MGQSAFDLDQNLANLILAFKDRGRTALADYLARQLLKPLQAFDSSKLTLVALPSSRAALVRRGFDSNWLLAKALAKNCQWPAAKGLLKFSRQPSDQRNLSAAGRMANLHGSMTAPKGTANVLLIDDIVTTGASLLDGRRALIEAGFTVEGFITIAETLRQNESNIQKGHATKAEWV